MGTMGYHMAGHMAKIAKASGEGSALLVWNRTGSKAEAHAQEFGSGAVSALQGLAECTIIVSCLPTTQEVVEATAVVAAARGEGALRCVWVDCTSGDPDRTRALAQELEASGIDLCDCPVSGGPKGAAAGTLTCMFGGTDSAYERALPVISSFAGKLERLGPVGSGMAVKAINNALNVAHLMIASEGLLALKRHGVDPTKALSVINKSSGRSLQTEVRLPETVFTRKFDYGFKLGLMKKDCGIAAEVLRTGFPNAPLLPKICDAVAAAAEARGNDADYTEVVRWLEEQAKEELNLSQMD